MVCERPLFIKVVRGGKSVIRKSCVTIMCRNDELSSTMSRVGCLPKDSELFILFAEDCQILLKISVIPIILTFMYLVSLNLLLNNQLYSLSNSTHHCGRNQAQMLLPHFGVKNDAVILSVFHSALVHQITIEKKYIIYLHKDLWGISAINVNNYFGPFATHSQTLN